MVRLAELRRQQRRRFIASLPGAEDLKLGILYLEPSLVYKVTNQTKHKILTGFIAGVWLVNGFGCKVLNLVPRHEQIVARILGDEYSRPMTILIGLSEMLMAIWLVTNFKSRLNAVSQIFIVSVMNTIEFILTPDLLLWGRWNSVFAFMFIGLVYYNEFVLNKKLNRQT